MGAGIGGLEADWTGMLRRAIVAGRPGARGTRLGRKAWLPAGAFDMTKFERSMHKGAL